VRDPGPLPDRELSRHKKALAPWRIIVASIVVTSAVAIACMSTFVAAVLIAKLFRETRFGLATLYGICYFAALYITFLLARDVLKTIRHRMFDDKDT
jgi:sterol desaturase/sphingolipid hydroxylase (fatty acid hydroxylase superfamily)